MILHLAKYKQNVGSREGGKLVRAKIESLLQSSEKVVIDFSNVHVISSGFADEVFGRLFVKLNPRGFMRRIEIRAADATADVIIDRAIYQRTLSDLNGNGAGKNPKE